MFCSFSISSNCVSNLLVFNLTSKSKAERVTVIINELSPTRIILEMAQVFINEVFLLSEKLMRLLE